MEMRKMTKAKKASFRFYCPSCFEEMEVFFDDDLRRCSCGTMEFLVFPRKYLVYYFLGIFSFCCFGRKKQYFKNTLFVFSDPESISPCGNFQIAAREIDI